MLCVPCVGWVGDGWNDLNGCALGDVGRWAQGQVEGRAKPMLGRKRGLFEMMDVQVLDLALGSIWLTHRANV